MVRRAPTPDHPPPDIDGGHADSSGVGPIRPRPASLSIQPPRQAQRSQDVTELASLIAEPGAASLPYCDPVFPDQPLVLHSARPARFSERTPVLFVHHGVARNG